MLKSCAVCNAGICEKYQKHYHQGEEMACLPFATRTETEEERDGEERRYFAYAFHFSNRPLETCKHAKPKFHLNNATNSWELPFYLLTRLFRQRQRRRGLQQLRRQQRRRAFSPFSVITSNKMLRVLIDKDNGSDNYICPFHIILRSSFFGVVAAAVAILFALMAEETIKKLTSVCKRNMANENRLRDKMNIYTWKWFGSERKAFAHSKRRNCVVAAVDES